MLMWSHYDNSHKGFCIEYDLSNLNNKQILKQNLYPVIYSVNRKNLSKYLLSTKLSSEDICLLYKNNLLRKNYAWSYENEWRLIIHKNMCFNNDNIEFFPIKSIYFGTNMSDEEKEEIYKLAKDKQIKCYFGKVNKELYEIDFFNYPIK